MASGPRLFVAALIVAASACGLVYDVDEITADESCGTKNAKCCAGQVCGDGLVCLPEAADAGTDAGCECPSTDGSAGSDAQGSTSCACETNMCRLCGGPDEPCCDHKACLGDGKQLQCTAGKCEGSCGSDGEPCCKDISKVCGDGLTCETEVCHVVQTPCSQPGQACCAGSCTNGLTCQGELCQLPVQPECGAQGQACCTTGATCDTTSLKCNGATCEQCGGEAQICCDNPQCAAGSLTCQDGYCRTCPYAGATCGGATGSVCMGTGGGEQCAACGSLGQNCCSGSIPEPCPNQLYCCNGTAADGCNACTTLPCTCKVCCVRCGNWAAGSYQKVNAGPGGCDDAGIALCAGKGGKAFAQFRNACPP